MAADKEALLQEIGHELGNTEHAAALQEDVREMWYTLHVLAAYFPLEKVHEMVEAGMPTSRPRINVECCR